MRNWSKICVKGSNLSNCKIIIYFELHTYIVYPIGYNINIYNISYDIILLYYKKRRKFFMYYLQRLMDLRKGSDLSQVDITELLNTTQPQYNRYETGLIEIPVHHVITLAKFYKT